ncbi:MAG: response regulator transcription factor [Clostridiales bacterium]|nr:response regulator transcription factor [Clostridiales bacterium]
MDRIKVLIADDSDFVREGMKIILETDGGFDVIGCAANGEEALKIARMDHPDVFLMDIQMPVMDGIEATKIITGEGLGKVLILTTFDDDELVRKALANGASGYLIKNHTPDHLKQTIRSVYNGMGVMEETMLGTLTEGDIRVGKGFDGSGYSERELEIVKAVAEGLSNKEIASRLFISEGTVKNYITNILSREGLSHRTALAVYYLTGKK